MTGDEGGADPGLAGLAVEDLDGDDDAGSAPGRDRSGGAGTATAIGQDEESRPPRPLIERLGMAAIALVLAALFGAMAAAAFSGGEPFLGVMAATGTLMTLWVAALTLRRG